MWIAIAVVVVGLLSGCASIDVDALKRVAKNRGLTLIESREESISLKRGNACHCPMLQYELKF